MVRFGWVDVVVWVLTFSQNLVKFYHTLKKFTFYSVIQGILFGLKGIFG